MFKSLAWIVAVIFLVCSASFKYKWKHLTHLQDPQITCVSFLPELGKWYKKMNSTVLAIYQFPLPSHWQEEGLKRGSVILSSPFLGIPGDGWQGPWMAWVWKDRWGLLVFTFHEAFLFSFYVRNKSWLSGDSGLFQLPVFGCSHYTLHSLLVSRRVLALWSHRNSVLGRPLWVLYASSIAGIGCPHYWWYLWFLHKTKKWKLGTSVMVGWVDSSFRNMLAEQAWEPEFTSPAPT